MECGSAQLRFHENEPIKVKLQDRQPPNGQFLQGWKLDLVILTLVNRSTPLCIPCILEVRGERTPEDPREMEEVLPG